MNNNYVYFTDLLSSEEFFSWSAFITITEPSPCMWQLCPNPMSSTNVLQRLEMIQLLWSFSRGSSNFCLEWGYLSMENTCIAGITFILDTRWPLSWHILSLKNVSIILDYFFSWNQFHEILREIDFTKKFFQIYRCGGSILNKRFVISAMHCFHGHIVDLNNPKKDIVVGAGMLEFNHSTYCRNEYSCLYHFILKIKFLF